MADAPVLRTREELYRLVWSTPIQKLSKQFGLSDVGFAKVCARVEVPRPPRGYWAKIASGHKPRQAPLRKASDPSLESFVFEPLTPSEIKARETPPPAKKPFDARIGELLAAQVDAQPIVVQPTLARPHPLVASTAKAAILAAKQPRTDRYGHIEMWSHLKGAGVSIQTSAAAADRALRILDALVKALGERGCPTLLIPSERGLEQVATKIDGDPVWFSIREKVRQRAFDPKRDGNGKDSTYRFLDPKVIYEPNGVLSLYYGTVERERGCSPPSGSVTETKRTRLEDCLNDVIVAVYWMLDDARRRKEDARLERIAQWNVRKQKMEEARLQQETQERVDGLLRSVENWHRGCRIREFVTAVRDHHAQKGNTIPDDSDLGRYLRWASGVADGLDPLRPQPAQSSTRANTLVD
jgi:hypothetical protein